MPPSSSRPAGGPLPREVDPSLAEGRFAGRQIFAKEWLFAWSHRRRFGVALDLARQFAGRKVLDYGCGDATFLGLLMAGSHRPASAVGAEVDTRILEDLRGRLGHVPDLTFTHVDQLRGPEHAGRYDGIFCMEVLEHVVDPSEPLDLFPRLLAPGGRLVVSVPVETGLPLLVKHAARKLAHRRDPDRFPRPTPYSLRDLAASVLATPSTQIPRPLHPGREGRPFHEHKGFNWMALRRRFRERLEVERTFASPVSWLSPHLGSQVWLVGRPRP